MNTSKLKLLVGAVVTLAAIAPVQAALVHLYEFNGNMNDSVGSIALVNNGGTLNPTSLSFGQNQGPTLNAEASLAGTYSIGLRFSFDQVSGWRKIIDFKNRADDRGQYLFNGSPYFYNYAGGSGSVAPNETVDFVLTRDGGTGLINAYLNGVAQFSFIDSAVAGVASIIGSDAVFHFFRDDFATSQAESSAGIVDEIRVWNSVLAGGEIADAFAPVPEPSTYLAGALLLLPFGAQGVRYLRNRKHVS